MKRLFFTLSLVLATSASTQTRLTVEEAIQLMRRFAPPQYFSEEIMGSPPFCCGNFVEVFHGIPRPNGAEPRPLINPESPHAADVLFGEGAFLELRGPWEPKERYVLLYYQEEWVLIRSEDQGAHWEKVQDSGYVLHSVYFGGSPYATFLSQGDLDLDGIPEVLISSGGEPQEGSFELFIYAFRNGKLELISPVEKIPIEACRECSKHTELIVSKLYSYLNKVALDDVDGDNLAEVVVYPNMRDWDEAKDGSWEKYSGTKGPPCRGCVEEDMPIRVYKLTNGKYELWKEIDKDEPYPFGHPALGVFHPGLLSLSQLKNAQGLGELRVFVSGPAIGIGRVRLTADDYNVSSFHLDFNGKPLAFKKKRPNRRWPELDAANQWVNGVWVREEWRQGCPPWNVDPAQAAFPHPHPCQQYTFVGPYLELTLRAQDVADYILLTAEKLFHERQAQALQSSPSVGPEEEPVFVEVKLVGALKSGKRVMVSAMVAVRKDPTPQKPQSAQAHTP